MKTSFPALHRATDKTVRSPHFQFQLRLLTAASLSALCVASVQAQDSYWTFGIGAGQTRGAFDEVGLTNKNARSPTGSGLTINNIATDRRDAGGKVFLGRQFNRYLGMEVGYFDLGKFGWQASTTPAGTLTGEIRPQGANVDLLGTLPLVGNLSALGRVGATYARTRSDYASSGAVAVLNARPSERKDNMKLGLGLQYAFNDHFQMRAEAEEYRISDALGGRGKVKMYSVSLVVPFGRTMASAPRAAYMPPTTPAPMPAPAPQPRPEPAVVMAAPAPAPVMAQAMPAPAPPPAPVVVPLRRVSYAAETMFGFDASAVRPEGKAALDKFSAELMGTQYDNIVVEGHTDRLGSSGYNQTLSAQRAEAVKDHLVRVGGLPAGKVSTVGKGEAEPLTKAEDCKGNAPGAKLIACLQPDRRVEIEVSGTR